MSGRRPRVVIHADWSAHPEHRWMASAVLRASGRYLALPPARVGELDDFWPRLEASVADGPVLLGFDFPIGLPRDYAERAGIGDFVAELPRFGDGDWRDFYRVAAEAREVSPARPFFPRQPRGRRRQQLLDGLGLSRFEQLLRRCDRATDKRPAAGALFWTVGPNQVGQAAISGWRDLLAPALRSGLDVAIWPFHGRLDALLRTHHFVVAEAYPSEFYGHLGIAPRRAGGKGRPRARQASAHRLLEWATAAGVELAPALACAIRAGFGASANGSDRFDAVIGLLGMLNVILGGRPPGVPDDALVRTVEGWILGQQERDESG